MYFLHFFFFFFEVTKICIFSFLLRSEEQTFFFLFEVTGIYMFFFLFEVPLIHIFNVLENIYFSFFLRFYSSTSLIF